MDLGCGTGLYSLTFLKMGAKLVCGQDLMESSIVKNKERAEAEGFKNFVGKVGDCCNLHFEDSYFDYVFSGDVFEHIDESIKRKFIQEAYRVLKPGGYFTVKTPNMNYLKLTNFMRRCIAILKLKNPFAIHIAHTNNNPDNEHHGLVTHHEMIKLFQETMFHQPLVTYSKLQKRLPDFLANFMGKFLVFNQNIIITVRKPIFYGIYK